MSQGGLLDSAINTIQQLLNSSDLTTRSLANRALADIKRAWKMVPGRRKVDGTAR